MLNPRAIAVQGVGFSAKLLAVQGFAAEAAVAIITGSPGGVLGRVKYALVRKATRSAVAAFLRWQDELELSKKERVTLVRALKSFATSTVDDLDDTEFWEQVRLIRNLLLLALTQPIAFEVQQKTEKLLAQVTEHITVLEAKREENQNDEDEELLLMAAAHYYQL